MSHSENTKPPQGFCGRRPSLSTICPGMEIEPPLCTDAIAWNLILLGKDCGRSDKEINGWLRALKNVPFWPDRETLKILLRDAGL